MNAVETKLHNDLFKLQAVGFLLGLERSPDSDKKHLSHIYRGSMQDVGEPMCPKGYNRGKEGFSIWRNNIGLGICRNCLKRAAKEYSLTQ